MLLWIKERCPLTGHARFNTYDDALARREWLLCVICEISRPDTSKAVHTGWACSEAGGRSAIIALHGQGMRTAGDAVAGRAAPACSVRAS